MFYLSLSLLACVALYFKLSTDDPFKEDYATKILNTVFVVYAIVFALTLFLSLAGLASVASILN